jgi:hypothetical protein
MAKRVKYLTKIFNFLIKLYLVKYGKTNVNAIYR